MTRAARRRRDRRLSAAARARHLARGYAALFAYVPRDLARTLADHAGRFQTTRAVVLEAALGQALRQLTPSAIQHAVQQRKQRLGGLPR